MHFLAPLLLIGLAAAVLPWIIHRIGRRRARPVRFAAMELLLRAEREVSARRRLRDVALLLARTGLVIALPLAFARPFAEVRSDLPAVTTHSQSAVIILDESASMRRRLHRDDTPFDVARARARDIVEHLSPDSEIALVLASEGFGGAGRGAVQRPRARGGRAGVGRRVRAPRRFRGRPPSRHAGACQLDARRPADLRHHRSAGDRVGRRHAGDAGGRSGDRRAGRQRRSALDQPRRGRAWAPSPRPRRARTASRWSPRSPTTRASRCGASASRCVSTASEVARGFVDVPAAGARASASSTPCRGWRITPRW
jgi:hypothetical protein